MQYQELRGRLLPEALDLFRQLVSAHLAAKPGGRYFICVLGATGSTRLITPAPGPTIEGFDPGWLEDLAGYGLLRVEYAGRGDKKYAVSGEGVHFYRWLMAQSGEPIARAEATVREFTDGPRFAAQNPGASHHLAKAFDLLWSGRTDDQTVSELGDHLRKALFDVVSVLAGEDSREQEKPIPRLEALVDEQPDLGERERNTLLSLVDFVASTLSLDQRLSHIRDEVDKGKPLMSWSEARRACFLTAVACYEVYSAVQRQ